MRKIFSEPADPYINRSVSRSAFHCTFYFLQQSSFRLFIARSLLSPSKRWYSCVSTARLHALRFTTSCGLDKAKFVTTADAADGYWLAPLDKTTSYSLTAFDSPLGRLEWLCLPMGLQPSAGWFQKFLEDALRRHNLLYTGEFNKGRDAETGKLQNFVSTRGPSGGSARPATNCGKQSDRTPKHWQTRKHGSALVRGRWAHSRVPAKARTRTQKT
jgi:hypothetical protein